MTNTSGIDTSGIQTKVRMHVCSTCMYVCMEVCIFYELYYSECVHAGVSALATALACCSISANMHCMFAVSLLYALTRKIYISQCVIYRNHAKTEEQYKHKISKAHEVFRDAKFLVLSLLIFVIFFPSNFYLPLPASSRPSSSNNP